MAVGAAGAKNAALMAARILGLKHEEIRHAVEQHRQKLAIGEKGGELVTPRTFEQIWEDIEKLKGQTVYTLDQHVRNDIIDIAPKEVKRKSERGNGIKPVPIRAFRNAWGKLVEQGYCEVNKSKTWGIAAACLAYLPEVEYSLKPRKLHLLYDKKHFHAFGEPKEHKDS